MIDTHAHLDACDDDVAAIIDRAAAAGVERIVSIGAGIDSCRATLAIADAHEPVYAAVGIDPHRAADTHRIDDLFPFVGHPRVVGVGETGLDYHYGAETKRQQRALFEAQLELAADIDKALIVHCREAAADTADALDAFAGVVVLHCFSEPALLPAALERGYYVSFAGNVTYPNAVELRTAAARVPPDRLLVETDSPYLPPRPNRGRPNEPANIVHTVAALAEVRGEDATELSRRTATNARAAFGLP